MFGIEEVIKNAQFRELQNGYLYKIIDIDWDGSLCNVVYRLIENKENKYNIEEGQDLIDDIINDILSLDYFRKAEVDKYAPNACVKNREGNIYELSFITEEKQLHPIISLKKYCNGNEIKILSGDLKDKQGIYEARLNDIDERGFIEGAIIDHKFINLKDYKFEFTDWHTQLSWESILEE